MADVRGDGSRLELGTHLDILADPGGQFALADVTSLPLRDRFHPVLPGDLYLDMRQNGYWLRFRLYNPGSEIYYPVLRLMPIHVQQARLYQGDNTTALRRIDTQQLARDPIGFQLSLPPRSTTIYHMYLADERRIPVSLQLMGIERLILENRASVFSNGLAIGSLLIMGLFATLLGFTNRDKDYHWLTGYSLIIILTVISTWGILPGADTDRLFPTLVLLSMVFSVIIALRLPAYPATGHNGLRVALWSILLVNIAASILAAFSDTQHNNELLMLAAPATLAVLTLAPLITFLHTHSRLQLYYLLSRLWIGIIVMLTVIAQRYDLTHMDTSNALLLLGVSIEVLALTFLFMMRSLRRQRHARDQQLVIADRRARAVAQRDYRERLERELRRPLGQLLGMVKLLQNTLLSSSQRSYMNHLHSSANEIRTLLSADTKPTNDAPTLSAGERPTEETKADS